MKPLISIIVPVYKVPYDMLRRCLDSICAQTVKDFEAILIDDGSPDDCGAICDTYAYNHKNMRVLHQENGGLSVVRNNGVAAALGDWVCFVDGDDWIEPNSIEFAEKFVADCPDGDVLIWEEIIDTNGILKYNCFFEKPIKGITCFKGRETEIIIDKFFPRYYLPLKKEQYTDMGSTLARLYNKEFLIKNHLKNEPGLKRMQDNVFNLWVFDTANKVYYQTVHLYHYCYNPDSATKKYSPDFAETLKMLFSSIREFINERHHGDDLEEYNQRLYIKFIELFGQLFELDYASPLNKSTIRERINKIKRDFNADEFQEVLENVDIHKQRFKADTLWFLLKNKWYGAALWISVLNSKFRVSRRTKEEEDKPEFEQNKKIDNQADGHMIKTMVKKVIGQDHATQLKQYAKFLSDELYLFKHSRISPETSELLYRKFSLKNKHVFFGYYDIPQFDFDEKKLLVHVIDKGADTGRDSAELGYFLLENGEYIPFASSKAWCWQQGSRLRWDPSKKDTVLFNDIENGQYITRIFDLVKGKELGQICRALYDVDEKLNFGLSLNFSRLQRLRPGYGYSKLPDLTKDSAAPDDDGIFFVDIQNNTEKLLISLAKLAECVHDPEADQHYINHISISPDGNRFMFFHIWTLKNAAGWKTRLYVYDLRVNKLKLLEDCDRVSHYDWKNENEILVTCWDSSKNQYYCIYNIETDKKTILKKPALKYDGHPSVLSNETGFISDTYPLKHDVQTLFEYKIHERIYRPLIHLYSDARWYGEKRCDLHPRLSRSEEYISVDTTCEDGCRQVMLLKNWE